MVSSRLNSPYIPDKRNDQGAKRQVAIGGINGPHRRLGEVAGDDFEEGRVVALEAAAHEQLCDHRVQLVLRQQVLRGVADVRGADELRILAMLLHGLERGLRVDTVHADHLFVAHIVLLQRHKAARFTVVMP